MKKSLVVVIAMLTSCAQEVPKTAPRQAIVRAPNAAEAQGKNEIACSEAGGTLDKNGECQCAPGDRKNELGDCVPEDSAPEETPAPTPVSTPAIQGNKVTAFVAETRPTPEIKPTSPASVKDQCLEHGGLWSGLSGCDCSRVPGVSKQLLCYAVQRIFLQGKNP